MKRGNHPIKGLEVENPGKSYLFLGSIPAKHWWRSVALGGIRILLSTAWPFLLYRTLQQTEEISTGEITLHILLVAVLLLLLYVVSQLQSNANIRVIRSYTLELIEQIWKKINTLEWLAFHSKNRVYYFDMLLVEPWRIRTGVAALLENVMANALVAAVLSVFVWFIHWPLFTAFCVGILLMAGGQLLASSQTRPLLKRFHQAWRAQHLWVAKSIDQFDLIKMGRGYEAAFKAHSAQSTSFLTANTDVLQTQAKWRNFNQLLSNSVRIGVFVLGVYWVQKGVLGLNELLLGLLIISVIQTNLMQLPSAISSLIEAQESFKTMRSFFDLPAEYVKEPDEEVEPLQHIRIEALEVGYGDTKVLNALHLHLEVGKIYLWKGPNGSGKTTAAHSLLGLLHPQKGRLLINGLPTDWGTLRSLRPRFSFLNQDSPIFMGSIEENILFGHEDPVTASLTLQQTWLKRLLPVSEQAEQRWVGERGEGLSGGESKRVALIREMLRTSELIILDEPLNHLDEFAIQEIKRELLSIKQNAIVVIISHQSGFEEMADETIIFS
jgi:ABC-type bacteriocin/lantibiotic exporter with double-glycine peptidase domain